MKVRRLLILILVVMSMTGCAVSKGVYSNMVRYEPEMYNGRIDANVRMNVKHGMDSATYSMWKSWGNPESNIDNWKNVVAEMIQKDFSGSGIFYRVIGANDYSPYDMDIQIKTKDIKEGSEYYISASMQVFDPVTRAELSRHSIKRSGTMRDYKAMLRGVTGELKGRLMADYQQGFYTEAINRGGANQQRQMANNQQYGQPTTTTRSNSLFKAAAPAPAPRAQTTYQPQTAYQPQAAAGPQTVVSDVDTAVPSSGASNRNAIAVVIGNKDYKNKDIPSVDFARNDANAIKKYLVNILGYKDGNIIELKDASKAEFEAVFGTDRNHRGKLYNYLKKGKSDIFIYYSGHGAPDPENRQGYFVPTDADPQVIGLTGYSLELLYKNIALITTEMNTPSTFIVIDTCFSGATEKGLLLKNVSPITIEVKNPVAKVPNAVVMTSSSGSEVSSWYPEKGHSMFTYFFLKSLKEAVEQGKSSLSAGDVYSYISDETEGLPYYARRLHSRIQSPQMQGDKARPFFTKARAN